MGVYPTNDQPSPVVKLHKIAQKYSLLVNRPHSADTRSGFPGHYPQIKLINGWIGVHQKGFMIFFGG